MSTFSPEVAATAETSHTVEDFVTGLSSTAQFSVQYNN